MGAGEKPIRVYMVDDEIRAIQSVQRLLAPHGGDCVMVGSATGALTALREIPQLAPDIVLADINMPGMSGLDLVAELQRQGSGCIFFLLTAYKEFEFAKRGLQLGVAGYLLKHEIAAEGLLAEFRKHMRLARIDREKAHVFAERNLRQFLTQGGAGAETSMPAYRNSRGYFLAVLAEVAPLAVPPRLRQPPVLDCRALERAAYPEPLQCRNAIPLWDGVFGVFFTTRTTGDLREEQHTAADTLRAGAAAQGVRAACFLSEIVGDFFALPAQYERMRSYAENAFLLGAGSHFCGTIPATCAAAFHIRDLAPYEEHMKAHRWSDALENLQSALRGAADCGMPSYIAAVEAGLQSLRDYARISLAGALPDTLLFTGPGEIDTFFAGIFARLEETERQGAPALSPKIEKAAAYIAAHYAEDISVRHIADAVQLSEGHLRKLFRAEVGATIVDYLGEYRIEQAKRLLSTGDLRVVDVYRMVGFTSSQYFSNVFKKRVGESPNEFIGRGGRP